MAKPNHRTSNASLTAFDPADLPAMPDELGFSASIAPFSTPAAAAAQISGGKATTVRTTPTVTQVLYLQEPGTGSAISVSDINQGQMGDCFLLSSIGELALWHPGAIMNMITVNPDGSETVALHVGASGQLPTYGTTSFKTAFVNVTNSFPSYAVNNGAAQDVCNGQKEIWVQVLEKAVATLNGGYSAIANGGNPMIAMEELVGQPTTFFSPAALTLQGLQSHIAAGDLIVMDTRSSSSLPYGLYSSHAYMFENLTMVGGTWMVQLGNPWGFAQPSLIPFAQLSRGIAEIDVGQFADSNVILGGPGDDTKVLAAPIVNGYVDLGGGNNTLILATGTNSATVANTQTIIGGTGNDTITLSTAAVNTHVDLGAGNDKLILGNFTNIVSIANVETIVGGSGNDTVTLTTPLTPGMSVDLGGGNNTLTLAAGGSGTIANVNNLIGSSGADVVTMATSLVNGSVDLGGGNNILTLANGTNSVTVANAQSVIGGSGNDTIVLRGNLASMVMGGGGMNFITGDTAADEFVFDQNSSGSLTTLMNFGVAKGDKIALDTTGSSTLGHNTYDLGGAALKLNTDLADVANTGARLATRLANGGKGGFVYEQDNGHLYYSSNGSFATGGTMIGVITTDGVHPWAFNANSFVQV
jgi:Calpain family cysteine protease